MSKKCLLTMVISVLGSFLMGCGAAGTNGTIANSGTSTNANSPTNVNTANINMNSAATTTVVDAREPETYQATVTLRAEATGSEQKTQFPALAAKVARSATDRRMEFTMPAGGRVIFLDKNGTNYLIMPDTNQYAILDKQALGMDIRRMMTPGELVAQAKAVPGMQLVGDETYNGRPATKYKYAAVANTQSQAGQVTTESFMIVDKETGLPLHSETTSQAQSGTNVQGYTGLRLITEITDLTTSPAADLFADPTTSNMKKIESEQVRAQVDMIFNAAAAFLGQVLRQAQTAPAPSSATPVR
jgi:hypothetical protein